MHFDQIITDFLQKYDICSLFTEKCNFGVVQDWVFAHYCSTTVGHLQLVPQKMTIA